MSVTIIGPSVTDINRYTTLKVKNPKSGTVQTDWEIISLIDGTEFNFSTDKTGSSDGNIINANVKQVSIYLPPAQKFKARSRQIGSSTNILEDWTPFVIFSSQGYINSYQRYLILTNQASSTKEILIGTTETVAVYSYSNDYSMLFESANEEFVVIDDPVYSTSGYSISTWIKVVDIAGSRTYYSEGSTNGNSPYLWLYLIEAGYLRVTIHDDDDDEILNQWSDSTIVNDLEWHHIVWVDDNGTANIYIDGTIDTADFDYTPDITLIDLSAIGCLHRAPSNSQHFDGNIDEVSTWNIALSADDVTELYNAGVPTDLNAHTKSANLTHWWRMGENATFDGSDWTIYDEVGGAHGTSSNMIQGDRVDDVPA